MYKYSLIALLSLAVIAQAPVNAMCFTEDEEVTAQAPAQEQPKAPALEEEEEEIEAVVVEEAAQN